MGTIEKMVDDDLIALKKTINYIFKQNATANRKLMNGIFLKYILNCFTSQKTIQYSITYSLYQQLPKSFHTNKYKEIVCYAVNKYFPNNEVILFEKFLIDNNVKKKYVSKIKDKYIPTATTPQNYFCLQPFRTSDFCWYLHEKWLNTWSLNMKASQKHLKNYLLILIKKYQYEINIIRKSTY